MERHRHDQMTNTVALPLSCICHQSVAVTLHRHFTAYLCLEHVCEHDTDLVALFLSMSFVLSSEHVA